MPIGIMKPRHLEKSDSGYKVYLYVFYICGFIMLSTLVFGVYVTMLEWMENGTYVMGEAIHNTAIPFENFARVSTWIFFSTIIGWYCVSRIGWRRTAGDKIVGTKMALLQLMLLGFSIITLYEVLYNFTVLNAQISAGIINGIVPDIDRLSVAYPDPNRPWNLVFATKVFLAAFIISTHAFYLSIKPRKSLEEPEF
ncbi:hypothetical protein BD31_I1632 [Candidatus Nitrosopumilus salaria BD31]|uniref:Uncharacterized protein n=2 Tax=Nitrosopumilus TaxID=338191 RepID=I3D0C4_9ARCH|nr:hypothetical protein BD31_I1632 [Candidatus Nitrosopumilus salaria BD31]